MVAARPQRALTAWLSAPVAVRVLTFPVVSTALATTLISLLGSPLQPLPFCLLAAAGLVNVELGRLAEGGPVTEQRSDASMVCQAARASSRSATMTRKTSRAT